MRGLATYLKGRHPIPRHYTQQSRSKLVLILTHLGLITLASFCPLVQAFRSGLVAYVMPRKHTEYKYKLSQWEWVFPRRWLKSFPSKDGFRFGASFPKSTGQD